MSKSTAPADALVPIEEMLAQTLKEAIEAERALEEEPTPQTQAPPPRTTRRDEIEARLALASEQVEEMTKLLTQAHDQLDQWRQRAEEHQARLKAPDNR